MLYKDSSLRISCPCFLTRSKKEGKKKRKEKLATSRDGPKHSNSGGQSYSEVEVYELGGMHEVKCLGGTGAEPLAQKIIIFLLYNSNINL